MRVLIVPNSENDSARAAASELAAWLTGQGHEPFLLPSDAEAVGLPALGAARAADCALVVALGGDGTVLRAAHALNGDDVPVLGVNLGRLGFLTGADAHEMTEAVGAALEGRVAIEPLSTLDVTVRTGDGETIERRALNEVYVGRGGPGVRVVDLAVGLNGRPLMRFLCDGVIVSTPTGSTAYALSVGGPFVAPSVRGNVLVAVGAHTLAQRAFVLGPEDTVDISCPSRARSEACVAVDGAMLPCDRFGSVEVRRGAREVRLVRLHDRDYYDVVRRKFLGG